MRSAIVVTRVRFTPVSAAQRASGMLGYIAIDVNDAIAIDGATLRRTLTGELSISWPERRDRHGDVHRIVRPLDAQAKAELEAQVLAELSARGLP